MIKFAETFYAIQPTNSSLVGFFQSRVTAFLRDRLEIKESLRLKKIRKTRIKSLSLWSIYSQCLTFGRESTFSRLTGTTKLIQG